VLVLACALAPAEQELPYGVGSWPEAGHGNHRAVVRVDGPAPAVWAHIDWRRRDSAPETKGVRVVDLATGQTVTNVVRAHIGRESGDIIFQPTTVPGDYGVYYLPYSPGTGNFDAAGSYFAPNDTADPAWLEAAGLGASALAAGRWRELAQARVLRIEARTEFDRMDPMEVPATSAELAELLAEHADSPYLLFPEDRRFPIKMMDELPLRWIQRGPSAAFQGSAQPGEYYVFQIGVLASRQALEGIRVELAPLVPSGGMARPVPMTCFNTGGTDWLGRPMTREVSVKQGAVQALWFGAAIAEGASGSYGGRVRIAPSNAPATDVPVRITIAGEPVAESGDADLWRLSRLRWLNSTLGIDDDVVAPYTPLKVAGRTVECLDRAVTFGTCGLPSRITSRGNEILHGPVAFTVETAAGPVPFGPAAPVVQSTAPGKVVWRASDESRGLGLDVTSTMEADGCLTFAADLKALRDQDIADVRLDLPIRRETATYLMGMGKRGGFRRGDVHWKWDIDRADNMVWTGDVDAGIQLKLMENVDVWHGVTLRETGIPESWGNGGRGGCDITEEGDTVLARAYSGPRKLKAGESVQFRFRLLVTPFRRIDPRHWNWRHGDTNGPATVLHVHHGTMENPYINYPFWTWETLRDIVKDVKSKRTHGTDFGVLTYPAAGNLDTRQGHIHLWTTIGFDPKAGGPGDPRFNQSLLSMDFPNGDAVGFYWNIDDRGMRAYVRRGPSINNQYPVLFGTHQPGWEKGQRHLITLSWGERLAVYIDGELAGEAPYHGLVDDPLDGVQLRLEGHFGLEGILISSTPFTGGAVGAPTAGPDTLLLDTFGEWQGENQTVPTRGIGGRTKGVVERSDGPFGKTIVFSQREVEGPEKGVNVYYTVGQVSNHVAELWPLRSLGDEVLLTRSLLVTKVGDTEFGGVGGGYPWLMEHLVTDYVPGWRQPLPSGETCASISQQGLSRWHNYYIEGLRWLFGHTGIDGLYLDGIGYDREIMKRVAKVIYRNSPNGRINFHGGDSWSPPWDNDRRVSTANMNLEHFPYISSLWFGELFDYNMPPDFWLVEMSGIPFGLTGEMLNYENGGNPYRGMIYGMSGRQHPSAPCMWAFWDEFRIRDAEMLGYWDKACPVTTDSPEVLATVYRKPGRSLIALAHWPSTEAPRPRATAPRAAEAPVVDGQLEDAEWQSAAKLTRFHRLGTDETPQAGLEARVTHDGERLYIAFRCQQPGGKPLAATTERDGTVWLDDAIELFIAPKPGERTYYQFVGNARGVFADLKAMDTTWNGDWTYKAREGDGWWGGEASIPLADLGIAAGEDVTIGFNIGRDRQAGGRELSSWAPVRSSFHDPASFGTLHLVAAGTASSDPAPDAARDETLVRLRIDWAALGLDPATTTLRAPAIENFQPPTEFAPDGPIPVKRGGGWLLIAEPKG